MKLVRDILPGDTFYFGNTRYKCVDIVQVQEVTKVWFKDAAVDDGDDRLYVMHLPSDIPFEFFRHDKKGSHPHLTLWGYTARRMGKKHQEELLQQLYPEMKMVKPSTTPPLMGHTGINFANFAEALYLRPVPGVRRAWVMSCGSETRKEEL